MADDKSAKLKERDQAMRLARDEVMRRVGAWLKEMDFQSAGAGHYTRTADHFIWHIGFQKLSSGRNVRVMCHVDGGTAPVLGPWSDQYACPDSPNGKRYTFGWSTREVDIASSTKEYCNYINDVVIPWFESICARN